MNNLAIKIDIVSKIYKLYNEPIDRLKEAMHPFKKKYHKEFYALNEVSFEIKKGETVGILGKNGSGKSTLLKIITGVLNASSGNVQVNGRISALLELGAGFNPEYSGLKNIYLNGTMMGYTKEEMEKKVPAIVEFADIGDFIHQPVKTYSSGMFVRLAFAVAINVEPDILIVDEALSVGDIFFQLKCYKKFEEFKSKGKTILFVTHDMNSILKYCDRAVLLDKGIKVGEGTAKAMVDLYKKIVVNLDINNLPVNSSHSNAKIVWKESLDVNKDYLEYGNMKAVIIDYGVFLDENKISQILIKDENCTFKMKVMFEETIENPIFAFAIKDNRGMELTGTNTLLEFIDTGIVQKDTIVEIDFTQKMSLRAGKYLLSFGCTGYDSNGEYVVYNRLYDIVYIEVVSDEYASGIFDIYPEVRIIK